MHYLEYLGTHIDPDTSRPLPVGCSLELGGLGLELGGNQCQHILAALKQDLAGGIVSAGLLAIEAL